MVQDGHSSRARDWLSRLGMRKLTAGIGGLAVSAALLAAAAPAQAGAGATAMRIGAPAPVPAGSVRLGAVPAATVLHVDVVLAPRDPAALSQFVTAVSTPGSPLYHRYLAPGEFPARFGPTSAAIAAVRSALIARGLHPGALSASHLSIPVTATASQFEHAFAVGLSRYRLAGGRIGFANTTAPVLPAAAAAHVQGILGLSSLNQMRPLLVRPGARLPASRPAAGASPHVVTGGPQPCQAAINEANSAPPPFTAFTADQFASAYGFSPLYAANDFGQGITVGIVEFGEPNLPSDISSYQQCYGTHASVSYKLVDGFTTTGPGEGEAALDIETVISLAPRANIIVYRSPNSGQGVYDDYATIVAQDRARVVSISYGLCEHYEPINDAIAVTTLFEQGAAQGQTFVASSGDSGSEGCLSIPGNDSRLSVNFPASDPLVTGVGGTSLLSVGPPPGELVWNDGYDGDGAGGGGRSTIFSMPSYQKSFLKVTSGVREVPDVSADADPETGYTIIFSGNWGIIGGTSAAAPLWAALLALTDAKCPTSPVGFANPLIYYTASPADPTAVMNDIASDPTHFPNNVNNDYTGLGGGHYAVLNNAYDMATGIGSPRGSALAGELCKFSAEPKGYWLTTASGHVYAFGAPTRGSVTTKLASPVVGIATDPATNGYWLVTAKGKVYAFDAPNRGSVAGTLASPVVGIAADPATSGYWIVTAKGRVYSFHAPGRGSITSKLAAPVVGIAGDTFTSGYWVVTSAGKVYAFHAGAYAAKKVSGKVTGITSNPLHQGYWLVTATGHVYGFNIAALGGMLDGGASGRVIGLAMDMVTHGYWLTTATGVVAGIDATWHGDAPGRPLTNPIVGIASTH